LKGIVTLNNIAAYNKIIFRNVLRGSDWEGDASAYAFAGAAAPEAARGFAVAGCAGQLTFPARPDGLLLNGRGKGVDTSNAVIWNLLKAYHPLAHAYSKMDRWSP
jgi:hypothetical protein